jgi:hypothetical protein
MAKDKHHDAVRRALEKDGWVVTDDPLIVSTGGPTQHFLIDLGAERLFAAERNEQKIAVEVKVFGGISLLHDFHLALGQYLNYQFALELAGEPRKLYLAVPKDALERFERTVFPIESAKHYKIALIIYDPDQELIVSWQ